LDLIDLVMTRSPLTLRYQGIDPLNEAGQRGRRELLF
jgi:hypothetical protein